MLLKSDFWPKVVQKVKFYAPYALGWLVVHVLFTLDGNAMYKACWQHHPEIMMANMFRMWGRRQKDLSVRAWDVPGTPYRKEGKQCF